MQLNKIHFFLIILVLFSCEGQKKHEAFLYVTDISTLPRGVIGLKVDDYDNLSDVEKVEWESEGGFFKKSKEPVSDTALWIAPVEPGNYNIKCKVNYNDGAWVDAKFEGRSKVEITVSYEAKGKFKFVGEMREIIGGPKVVPLHDERIFILGVEKQTIQKNDNWTDYNLAAEIFSPSFGISLPFLRFNEKRYFNFSEIFFTKSKKILITGITATIPGENWSNQIIEVIDIENKTVTEVTLPFRLGTRSSLLTTNDKLIMILEDFNKDDSEYYYIYIFDPLTLSLTLVGQLLSDRSWGFRMEELKDGRIIIAGGDYLDGASTAEIFNPNTLEHYLLSSKMTRVRFSPKSLPLNSGEILFIGGFKDGFTDILDGYFPQEKFLEVFSPLTESFSLIEPQNIPELIDPFSASFTYPMKVENIGEPVLLPDERVLLPCPPRFCLIDLNAHELTLTGSPGISERYSGTMTNNGLYFLFGGFIDEVLLYVP